MRRPWLRLSIVASIAAASVMLGLAMGERWLNPFEPVSDMDAVILESLRWPRVANAAAVGALLAMAGAWLQALVGNPLAEPYVLGVAGSGSVGAILAIGVAGGEIAASTGAFVGAFVGTVAILPFVRLGPTRLLLAGVVLAALWGALAALALSLLGDSELRQAVQWMLGDLGASQVPTWLLVAGGAAALAFGLALARSLDRLALGETHAATSGTPVGLLRLALVLLASATTGLAVAAAGTVGFVGLIVPHAMRLLIGSPHRLLLPASALGGAALLVLADAGARSVVAPAELPVGVMTALLGVPTFLWLLARRTPWRS
ncbi:MAG: iron chelate uptake ABC transporter family permease subunit [Planctomycetota bacterium]|jgi:iron complex transport system permease protein|nr:ABC transporter permease [Deltaproteobacteria bacterium]MDP6540840.1 iron chelate uptake ABC transporter family permease subunit [Planctomycetota bacterium]